MVRYKLRQDGSGVIDTDANRYIPNSDGNRHWQEYQAWLAQGNTPDPADPPPPPPPNKSFPEASGNSIPALRAEVNALRQILLDYGIIEP